MADFSIAMAKVKAMIDAHELTKSEGGLKGIQDDLLKILDEHGLIVRVRTAPKHVGVHKLNRGGLGFTAPIEVQLLLKEILKAKFAWSLVEHAVSLQLPAVGDKDGSLS